MASSDALCKRKINKDEGFKSPSPVKKNNPKVQAITKDKDRKNEVMNSKKSLEESKEEMEAPEPVVSGHDSDNELDYEYGKQIDNSKPLKLEQGREKFKKAEPLPIFKNLFSSEICAALKRFGGSPAPLSLIGTFLNYVGSNILHHIHDKFKRRVFYPNSEVISIKHLPSGEIVTTVSTRKDGIEMKMQFKSKAVVVSNGGKPSIPREIFNYVPKDKLITADYFLKKDGFEAFLQTLNKNPTKRRIVIIGGSHSGFSCAWVLLNGPA